MIKFYALNDQAIERNSLVRSTDVSFDWVARAREITEQKYPIDKFPKYPPRTTKCPGIFSIMGTGWIQKSYIDFIIETNGDGESIKWYSLAEKQSKFDNAGPLKDYIESHPPGQLAEFKAFIPSTLKTVLKVQSPWVVDIPEGHSLLMMPIPYSDETRFTAAIGLLRGQQVLNVQLFWHCLNSRELIPAGTPLNQMILLKDEHIDYTISKLENDNSIYQEILDTIRKKYSMVINKTGPRLKFYRV